MKIIIAKKSGKDEEMVYINASRISSFHTFTNAYTGQIETKIYFPEGKCEIEGDKTKEIARFMSTEDECGTLNLANSYKSFWDKKGDKDGE